MTLLRATAIETEAELPFAGLHLLLRPTLGRLDRVPRPQALAPERDFGRAEAAGAAASAAASAVAAAGQPAGDVFLAGLAVLSLLAETVEDPEGDRPLLCLVDDAQWLDSASATALLFAARRLGSDGVAMVLAVRDGSPAVDTRGMNQLHLDPLDGAAARALLNDAAPGLDPHVGARVLADAAGNPLAITELARAAAPAPARGRPGRPGPLPATGAVPGRRTGCCGWPRDPRPTRCCWPRPPIYGRAATRPATAIDSSRWPTPPGASPTTIRSWPCGYSAAWWSRPATTARAGSRSGPRPRLRTSREPPWPLPAPGRPPRTSG
jgi:hypothetical protein